MFVVPGLDWLEWLEKNHQVKLVGFDKVLWEAKRPEDLFLDGSRKDPGMATDLRLPLARALEPSGADQIKVLGIVIFTDGQHNVGPAPVAKAKELGAYKV